MNQSKNRFKIYKIIEDLVKFQLIYTKDKQKIYKNSQQNKQNTIINSYKIKKFKLDNYLKLIINYQKKQNIINHS